MLACSDEGSGPAVVLIHGLGSDRSRWDPIVARLVDGFRCISVDLPGHGGSPDAGCDGLGAAVAVQEVVEHLGIEPPVVVGHSLGATVALLHGALFGPRSVVAVDPVHLHLPHLSHRLAPYRDRLTGDDFDAAFAEWEATLGPGPVGAPPLRDPPRPEVVRSYWRTTLDPDAAAEAQPRFEAALTAIAVPVLVWLADAPTPEDAAILARMRTTTVEVHPGAGHHLHLGDPDRFVARLRAWVAAHPPVRRPTGSS